MPDKAAGAIAAESATVMPGMWHGLADSGWQLLPAGLLGTSKHKSDVCYVVSDRGVRVLECFDCGQLELTADEDEDYVVSRDD